VNFTRAGNIYIIDAPPSWWGIRTLGPSPTLNCGATPSTNRYCLFLLPPLIINCKYIVEHIIVSFKPSNKNKNLKRIFGILNLDQQQISHIGDQVLGGRLPARQNALGVSPPSHPLVYCQTNPSFRKSQLLFLEIT